VTPLSGLCLSSQASRPDDNSVREATSTSVLGPGEDDGADDWDDLLTSAGAAAPQQALSLASAGVCQPRRRGRPRGTCGSKAWREATKRLREEQQQLQQQPAAQKRSRTAGRYTAADDDDVSQVLELETRLPKPMAPFPGFGGPHLSAFVAKLKGIKTAEGKALYTGVRCLTLSASTWATVNRSRHQNHRYLLGEGVSGCPQQCIRQHERRDHKQASRDPGLSGSETKGLAARLKERWGRAVT
jgi:hypothetical protein